MSKLQALDKILKEPTPEALWTLRGILLSERGLDDGRTGRVLGSFHTFLTELSSGLTARQYSQYASLLDIGALGGVLLERLLQAETKRAAAKALFGALLGEGMMVLGTRQHVKAWEAELTATLEGAAWVLYEEVWHLSVTANPELDLVRRQELVGELMLPARNPEVGSLVKAFFLGRLFQVVLAWNVLR